MARGDTATAEQPTDTQAQDSAEQAQAPAESDQTAADAKKAVAKAKRAQNRNTYTVPVTVPMELYTTLKAKADEDKVSVAQTARKLLAGYVNYTLPVTVIRERRKYASKEDRIAATKERNLNAKALLAALDSGEISPEILAKFLAAQNGNQTTESAPAEPVAEAVPA